ncbi:TerB family tellurite resistance protein [Oceanimonas sp. NS1]|nr:TerB family tellurite resistance protein [Oceanimonas sp. NS1]
MVKQNFSEFELIVIRSQNKLGIAVLLVLAWIAASDGSVDEREVNQLSEISVASKLGHEVKPLLRLVKNHDIKAIQLACEIIASHFRGEKARLFLEMAIRMSIADGCLQPTENHILRFLADLLAVDSVGLNSLFEK